MTCRTHPTRDAIGACMRCGSHVCNDCAVNTQDQLLCRSCLSVESHTSNPSHKISSGWLFFFSLLFPPGANYMYMGLIKRGLATMSMFFLIIFLITTASMPLTLFLALTLGVVYLASFFDGFKVRRRINDGETVADDVGDAFGFILKNRTARTIFLVAITVMVLVNVIGFAIQVINAVLLVLLIAFVIYLFVRKR